MAVSVPTRHPRRVSCNRSNLDRREKYASGRERDDERGNVCRITGLLEKGFPVGRIQQFPTHRKFVDEDYTFFCNGNG